MHSCSLISLGGNCNACTFTAHVVFSRQIRVGTWESAPALVAWVLLLNIFVKRCTSPDVENKVFSRLERTHIPERENSKSQWVAMTSDSGRGGSSGIRRRDRDARSAGSYTCILSRKPRPAQRGRNCEKSLTETAAVVTHCVFLLPPAGSSRRHKEDESIGQLSVYIG